MKSKNEGAGKPAPKGDTTQKRRQSRRRERLNEIAKASGFASWSAYETACLNGAAKPNKACSRRVQGCGVKKYHSKNKVMVGRTRR